MDGIVRANIADAALKSSPNTNNQSRRIPQGNGVPYHAKAPDEVAARIACPKPNDETL
jgi:hypothetical protein